eukprot:scaffold6286_cov82-Skeletonema_menzelii.AAC.9
MPSCVMSDLSPSWDEETIALLIGKSLTTSLLVHKHIYTLVALGLSFAMRREIIVEICGSRLQNTSIVVCDPTENCKAQSTISPMPGALYLATQSSRDRQPPAEVNTPAIDNFL